VLGLRFQSRPEAVAAFALSHDLIRPSEVPSELHRFAKIVAALRPEKVMETVRSKVVLYAYFPVFLRPQPI
jgi:hypothetical protein